MEKKLYDALLDGIIRNFMDLESMTYNGMSVIYDDFSEDQLIGLIDLYKDYYTILEKDKAFETPYTEILYDYFRYVTELFRLTDTPIMRTELFSRLVLRIFNNITDMYNYLKERKPHIILDTSRAVLVPDMTNSTFLSYGEEFHDGKNTMFLLVLDSETCKEIEKIIDENTDAFSIMVYDMTDGIRVNEPIKVLLFNIILNFDFSEEFIIKHFNIIPPWVLLKKHSNRLGEKSLEKVLGDGMTFFMNEILDRVTFHKLQNKFSTDPETLSADVLALMIKG